MRTACQREVLSAIVDRMRANWHDPRIYKGLIDVALHSIETNISIPELISLGEKVIISGKIETFRAPADACIRDNGSSIEIIDPQENKRSIYNFIYNQ